MNQLKNVIFIILMFWCWLPLNIYCLTETKSNLFFSENPIEFDPPIIKKENTYFIPIRTIVKYFDGSIDKSNVTYFYSIKIKKNTFEIKPNKLNYKLNNKPKKFVQKPFVYKTRLYVPITTFFENINYKLIKKKTHFYAHSNIKTPIKKPHKEIKKYNETIFLDYTSSENQQFNTMYLPISKLSLPLNSIVINNRRKTDLTEFLSYLGYSIKPGKSNFLLQKNSMIYSFKNNSNIVTLFGEKSTKKRNLNYTPTIKNNRFYVNLKLFLNDLGFDFLINDNTITVLKKLTSFTINSENEITMNKNSRIKLNKAYYLENPNRIYWDLSYTKCPKKAIKPNMRTIETITFGQKQTTCRMVFHLPKSYSTTIKKMSPTITKFTLKDSKKGNRTTTYKTANTYPLKGKTIIIDPGHGGADPGAVTRKNVYEKYYTLDIAKRIELLLKKKGARVILLRTKDINSSLNQRVRKINRSNGDFLVSVHINSFINGAANGSETYYYKKSERRAARFIQRELAKELNLKNNGVKHAKMYILKYSKIPGVLIEPCFLTNQKEYSLLKTTAFRNKIAKATVSGLEKYYKNK